MSRTRVVVTGLGTTSPVGGDVPSTWDALVNGRSGVRRIEADWVEELPVKIAGVAAVEPTEVIERVKARRMDRVTQLAMVAALEAWRDSGLADAGDDLDRDRLGVAMATGIGGVHTLLSNYDALKEKGPRRVSPLAVPMLMPNAPAANISLELGARAAARRRGVGGPPPHPRRERALWRGDRRGRARGLPVEPRGAGPRPLRVRQNAPMVLRLGQR